MSGFAWRPALDGLMGVMGETEGWMGERLVGEVTVRDERLRDREVEDLLSTMAGSLSADWEFCWEGG